MHTDRLRQLRTVYDLPALFAELGYVPDEQPFASDTMVIARWRGFRVVAAEHADARAGVRKLAGLLASGATRGLAVVLDAPHELALAAPRLGGPGTSRVLAIPLAEPSRADLQHLSNFKPRPGSNGLAHALRVDELLSSETVSERFFRRFRDVHRDMVRRLETVGTESDRHMLSLLPLTRVLFLYFVQAKGWLDARTDYLRTQLDDALARGRHFHRDVLNPLFFEALNRPFDRRPKTLSFGTIPYLNGGLFEPHPIEIRHASAPFDNDVWQYAFDDLFERFRFCVREAHEVDAVAPDMLGRVFERVMDIGSRHTSGSFYTPERIVRQIVTEVVKVTLAGTTGLSLSLVNDIMAGRTAASVDRKLVVKSIGELRLLDPAVGSGAFLLGALDALTDIHVRWAPADSRVRVRKRIIERNLFGVDLNPIAVRLAELRLWLAVIADDPTTEIRSVHPLPNLDAVVRQGDSLMDPIGLVRSAGAAGATVPVGLQRAVQKARSRVFGAQCRQRKPALQRLRRAESSLARYLLCASIKQASHRLRDLATAARGRDLFGTRRGLTPAEQRVFHSLYSNRKALRRALTAVREGTVPFFSYDVHVPEIMTTGGFSAVMGNPPWVRAERIPPDRRRQLAGRFDWCRPSSKRFAHFPDLSIPFLQRALELVTPGGCVGLLLPSKIVSADYAERARSALAAETTVRCLHRVPERDAAEFRATTYPLAVVITKGRTGNDHAVRLQFDGRSYIPQHALRNSGPWTLIPNRMRSTLADLRNAGTPLGRIAPASLGIKTGANRVFLGRVVAHSHASVTLRTGYGTIQVPPTEIRAVISGTDVRPFHASSRKVILWGYDETRSVLPRLSRNAMRYLGRHRRLLKQRTDYRGGQLWTLFRLRIATSPHRVVWADIVREPSAVALDATLGSDVIPLNTCYVSALADRDSALVTAAVLNSGWTNVLLGVYGDEARGGYRRMNARVANLVPIPHRTKAWNDIIEVSTRAHRGKGIDQAELDRCVADALDLPSGLRATVEEFRRLK